MTKTEFGNDYTSYSEARLMIDEIKEPSVEDTVRFVNIYLNTDALTRFFIWEKLQCRMPWLYTIHPHIREHLVASASIPGPELEAIKNYMYNGSENKKILEQRYLQHMRSRKFERVISILEAEEGEG